MPIGLLVFLLVVAWVAAAFLVAARAARKGRSYWLWFCYAFLGSPVWSAIYVYGMTALKKPGDVVASAGHLYTSQAGIVADIDKALADGVPVSDIQRHWVSLRASNQISYHDLATALAHLGVPAEGT